MQITGKTCFVTGGLSGLGAACAERFLAAGAHVVIADIDPATDPPSTVEPDVSPMFIRADVTSADQINAAISLAMDHFGGIDIVVNCAGILSGSRVVGRDGPHDLELFSRILEVNLIGTFNVTRLVAAHMCDTPPNKDRERGVIINTSSIAAFEGQIGQAAYSASKGGVASMTLPLAREFAPHGIRVVTIAPGVFDTSMMSAAAPKINHSLAAQTVFPSRFGKPAEFAAFAQHIVENQMLNGCILRCDGAMRMAAT